MLTSYNIEDELALDSVNTEFEFGFVAGGGELQVIFGELEALELEALGGELWGEFWRNRA
jgi:hypothetical protein